LTQNIEKQNKKANMHPEIACETHQNSHEAYMQYVEFKKN
jgi:hypothetical protein